MLWAAMRAVRYSPRTQAVSATLFPVASAVSPVSKSLNQPLCCGLLLPSLPHYKMKNACNKPDIYVLFKNNKNSFSGSYKQPIFLLLPP